MERIFTLRDERRISKSLDFSYQGKLYQIQSKTPNRLSGKSITIFEKFDGSFWVEFEGKKLDITALKDIPKAIPVEDSKTINSFLNKQKPLTAIQRYRKRGKCMERRR